MQHLSETIKKANRLVQEFDRKRAFDGLTRAFIANNARQVNFWFDVYYKATKRLSECDAAP